MVFFFSVFGNHILVTSDFWGLIDYRLDHK